MSKKRKVSIQVKVVAPIDFSFVTIEYHVSRAVVKAVEARIGNTWSVIEYQVPCADGTGLSTGRVFQ